MLQSFLSKLRSSPITIAPIAPDTAFAVIGDIHGCADLLETMLAQLDPALPVICVGDYVDRGNDSDAVLALLHARPDIICLKGNHEEMMLQFLVNPVKYGPRWLRHGGMQTLASFGISGLSESAPDAALTTVRNDLYDALGQPLTTWLSALPLQWQSGNVVVVHAGADPALPMPAQPDQALLWGHRDFATTPRRDGFWVAHGHTIVDEPIAKNGRIAIDTGAYATGRLSAAILSRSGVEFVST